MKNVFYLFALCLVFEGCWYRYSVTQHYGNITNIPSPPSHNKEVNIFMPGEELPQRPYLKLKMVSVSGDENEPDNQLLNKLKKKAQYEGIDDVILMDKSFKSELVTETHGPGLFAILFGDSADQEVEEITYLQNTKELSGMGIKYIDNMEYVKDIIKTENIYTLNPDHENYELAAYITYKLTGETQELEDENSLFQFFNDHSLNHLLYDESGSWRYKPVRQQFVRRKLIVDGEIYKICDVTLDESRRVSKIEITITGEPKQETIEYSYDKNKRLTGCVMRTNRFPYLREERIYKANGDWKEFLYYDESGKLLMKHSWVGFAIEDLKLMVR